MDEASVAPDSQFTHKTHDEGGEVNELSGAETLILDLSW